jgi:hypothetical protein
MNKAELKAMLKPLIKELIREELLESNLLSHVVSEVVRGTVPALTESVVPAANSIAQTRQQQTDLQESQTIESNSNLPSWQEKYYQHRRSAVPEKKETKRVSLNVGGVDVFKDTSTVIKEDMSDQYGALRGTDPDDAGVDLRALTKLGIKF